MDADGNGSVFVIAVRTGRVGENFLRQSMVSCGADKSLQEQPGES